ncbi:hypothetical protein ACFQH2_08475 [Natronoarchaeum sp. GCM10025703]|uniref:DUF7541 family protein n=1 Tax=Natronoarchaeum sp. GCM10025703 TaxID=3252685 RepID=UPI003622B078
MNEEPGLSDQYRKSSPWPMLIALGIVFSEVGIVLALFPVAVGGLVLLLGSIGGILRETEYVSARGLYSLGSPSYSSPSG